MRITICKLQTHLCQGQLPLQNMPLKPTTFPNIVLKCHFLGSCSNYPVLSNTNDLLTSEFSCTLKDIIFRYLRSL